MSEKQPLLEKLKGKREQINARIQKLEAAEKTRERKKETRRKILVGAYYLDRIRKEDKMDMLMERMDAFLTRNSDRVLFDLPVVDDGEHNVAKENESASAEKQEEIPVAAEDV